MKENTLALVKEVVNDLEKDGITVLLGGGWAEELLKISPASHHKDIDLYYPASSFVLVDEYIKVRGLQEIKKKHMAHKRAYLVQNVMVEIVLIKHDAHGYFSSFWVKKIIRWPESIMHIELIKGLPCLSHESLVFYRSMHNQLFGED